MAATEHMDNGKKAQMIYICRSCNAVLSLNDTHHGSHMKRSPNGFVECGAVDLHAGPENKCPACGDTEPHVTRKRPLETEHIYCTNKKCGMYEIPIPFLTWAELCKETRPDPLPTLWDLLEKKRLDNA